jgi:hypothetical protein
MSRQSSYREIESIAEQYGFDFVKQTGKGHYQWRCRTNGRIAHTCSTLANPRTIRNTEANFRQASRLAA